MQDLLLSFRVRRTVSEIHQLLQILSPKLLRFLGWFQMMRPLLKEQDPMGSFQLGSCRRVPNAGNQLDPLTPFLLSLVGSELRTLGWLICHRMDTGDRDDRLCDARPFFPPISFQPFFQLCMGPEISPNGENQLFPHVADITEWGTWALWWSKSLSLHEAFIENNLHSQLTFGCYSNQ